MRGGAETGETAMRMLIMLPHISGTADASGPSGQGMTGAGSVNSGPVRSQGVVHSGCAGENRGHRLPGRPGRDTPDKAESGGGGRAGPGVAENSDSPAKMPEP